MERLSMTSIAQDSPWTVSLRGSFRLMAPGGEVVRLQNSKVEALFGVLVRHREFGISRDELAAIVWPGKPSEDQKSSLRQALSLCRRAIGDDAIEASRSHCRVSDHFRLEVLPGTGIFMPGHEGEYFDEIRSEDLAGDFWASERRSVLDAWLEVLEWNARNDPALFFTMLRMTPHQAEGLAFADLERLLAQASGPNKSAWCEYWWGTVLKDLEECKKHLRTALDLALKEKDYELISKICLELGRACSRTGRLKRAATVSKLADEVAAESGAVSNKVNALRLKGTLNFHWGDPQRGNALFQRAIHMAPSTIEEYQLTASLALFQAGYGFDVEAAANIEKVRSFATSLGHMKLNSLVQLTQCILLTRSLEPKRAYDTILEVSMASDTVSEQITGYTEELLSSLCDRMGETKLANAHRARALEARQTSRDVTTNWVKVLRGQVVVGPAIG